jgi:flagellar biosynthesis/type III secretory pathway ATPase
MPAMATKKCRLQPAPGAREQAKRAAERVPAAGEAQKDLIPTGAYKKGTAPRAGLADAETDATNAFIRQGTGEKTPPANTLARLRKTF